MEERLARSWQRIYVEEVGWAVWRLGINYRHGSLAAGGGVCKALAICGSALINTNGCKSVRKNDANGNKKPEKSMQASGLRHSWLGAVAAAVPCPSCGRE